MKIFSLAFNASGVAPSSLFKGLLCGGAGLVLLLLPVVSYANPLYKKNSTQSAHTLIGPPLPSTYQQLVGPLPLEPKNEYSSLEDKVNLPETAAIALVASAVPLSFPAEEDVDLQDTAPQAVFTPQPKPAHSPVGPTVATHPLMPEYAEVVGEAPVWQLSPVGILNGEEVPEPEALEWEQPDNASIEDESSIDSSVEDITPPETTDEFSIAPLQEPLESLPQGLTKDLREGISQGTEPNVLEVSPPETVVVNKKPYTIAVYSHIARPYASLLVNGKPVICIRTPLNGLSPLQQVQEASSHLVTVLRKGFNPARIEVKTDGKEFSRLQAGTVTILAVDATGADVAAHATPHSLMAAWQHNMQQAFHVTPPSVAPGNRWQWHRNKKWYEPTGKTSVGKASWYGPGFNGRRTASGSRFDMNELTAAHRTLPFGTIVRVVNKRNGKACLVTINDRGPYSHSRLIDLSKGAAQKLGMLGSGVASIQMEVLKPATQNTMASN